MTQRLGERFREAGRLFDELVELTPTERAERLAELSAGDPELARVVEAMLAADGGASTTLEDVVRKGAKAALDSWLEGGSYRRGDRIGAWRIVSELGRGGMGEVYLAERADGAYEQRVALKRIRTGLGSGELAIRFLRERQILARLEHANIARLLDGGVDPSGVPYLVLEHVAGVPITSWANERGLSVRATVELLLEAMAGVEAAHRALIVHRDLKPSNLLVGDDGRPKLLDFGIAKLLDEAGDPTATRAFLPIFTPAYAAPEQLRGGVIGTATDVYALGVLLFELLVGERPFARSATTPAELVAELASERLERPSVALRRRAAATGDPAERSRLLRRAREVEGDLDAIVALALEPDASRRYPTVALLDADLRRHLARLPIEARGRARAYRVARFFVRHRFVVSAAAAVTLALLAGLTLALVERERALAEARRAEVGERFLIELFETVDPSRSLGETVSARDLLDRGARKLEEELPAQPRTRAALVETLAKTYLGLGVDQEARRWAQEAIALRSALDGAESTPALSAELLLGRVDTFAGELEAAERRLSALVPRIERASGRESPLAIAAETALAETHDLAASDDSSAIETWRGLYERTLRVHGPRSLETATALGRYSDQLAESLDFNGAEAGLREALEIARQASGARSPQAIDLAGRLAHVLNVVGKDDEALELYSRIIADARLVFGDDHTEVANWLSHQGVLLSEMQRLDEASSVLAEAEGIYRRRRHFDLGAVLRWQGQVEMARERFEDAARRFEAAHAQLREDLGADHPLFWAAQVSLAHARIKLGRLDSTEAMLREAIAAQERIHGAEGSIVRQSLKVEGELLRLSRRPAEALAVHERALAIERKLFGTDEHLGVVFSRREIALDHLAIGGTEHVRAARGEIEPVLAYFRAHPAENERLGRALWVSGLVAAAQGERARAERELAEASERLERALGADAPSSRLLRADRDRFFGSSPRSAP